MVQAPQSPSLQPVLLAVWPERRRKSRMDWLSGAAETSVRGAVDGDEWGGHSGWGATRGFFVACSLSAD